MCKFARAIACMFSGLARKQFAIEVIGNPYHPTRRGCRNLRFQILEGVFHGFCQLGSVDGLIIFKIDRRGQKHPIRTEVSIRGHPPAVLQHRFDNGRLAVWSVNVIATE